MSEFQDKIALVTGASRGIGRAVALGLAKEGAHVIALARTRGALEELDDEIKAAGGTVTLMKMNLSCLEDIDKLGPSIYERFGKLDILIGNAGVLGPLTPVHQVNGKDWDKVMKVNFAANVRLIRVLDPLLRAAPAGRAVFTHHALTGFPAYWGAYMTSKAALESLVKTYAAETRKTNMKINLVNPGVVDTKMIGEAFPGGYQGEMKKSEDVVDTYLGLCSDQCDKSGEIVAA